MKRIRLAIALAALTAVALLAAAASAAGPRGTKISLRRTEKGMILVNARGRTLYGFTKDGHNQDRCVTTAGCTSVWPVVTTKAKPVAGKGVKASKLGMIKLSDGSRQVTYAGHPLYTYIGDERAGDTGYVGQVSFGGTWVAINAAGKELK
jgi:predicted lipoprotein with Yx(FWY)xxD motif